MELHSQFTRQENQIRILKKEAIVRIFSTLCKLKHTQTRTHTSTSTHNLNWIELNRWEEKRREKKRQSAEKSGKKEMNSNFKYVKCVAAATETAEAAISSRCAID